jgi:hypothetical protein
MASDCGVVDEMRASISEVSAEDRRDASSEASIPAPARSRASARDRFAAATI